VIDVASTPAGVDTREEMLLALESLYLRCIDEHEHNTPDPRAQLGGAGLVRIAIERYLLRTARFLLERVRLPAAKRKQWDDAEQFAASKLCKLIARELAVPETANLPEVSATLEAVGEHQLFHRANDELSALLHGRQSPPPSPQILGELMQFCSRLLQRLEPRPWRIDRATACVEWSVLRPSARTRTHEFYLALDERGRRRTLIVSRDRTAARPDARAELFAPSEALHASSRAGLLHGIPWVLAPVELGITFADIVDDTHGGESGLARALELSARLMRLGRLSPHPNAILFAREDSRFDAPFVLRAISADSREAPRAITALVAFGATATENGDAHARWLEHRAPRSMRPWLLRAMAGGAPFATSDAMRDALDYARRALPEPHGLSLLGSVRPRLSKGWRIGGIAAATFAFGAIAIAGTIAGTRAHQAPRAPVTMSDAYTLLARWDESVQGMSDRPFEDLYADNADINARQRRPARDRAHELRSEWTRRRELGGFFRIGPRTLTFQQNASQQPANSACADPSNPQARVLTFTAHATWRNPEPNRFVPCSDLQGPFKWQLRESAEGWRICREGWEFCEAICRSCSAAPDCPRRCPGGRPQR
jgi:hypothetical protein